MTSSPHLVRDNVAIVTLDNPPVNALSHAVRAHVAAALALASADSRVEAIVLAGSSRAFSGGADIREFGTEAASAAPTLHQVIEAVESSTKPVVAAIAGVAMGGGLELALACHFRVALPDARVAFPEVKLGILPGAGGTQRLPRLTGVETALDMIVSGEPRSAKELAATALFDEILEGGLAEAAAAFARRVARGETRAPQRVRDLPVAPPAPGLFERTRARLRAAARGAQAPLRCVDAVEASVTKPFDEGIRFERALFDELVRSPEARAMRHAFFAERAAARISGVPDDTRARPIASVGVVGAGTMGSGIATAFLEAGLPVVLLDLNPEVLEKGAAAIRKNFERALQKGRITADGLAAAMARLTPALSYDGVAGAELVVEAVFEDLRAKQAVFEQLDAACKPGAILATNTSTLDVNAIASFTSRPESVVGLHFFNPANVMRLLEVVRGAKTAPDVLATAMQLARTLKKVAVVSGVCDGFIGNRMLHAYLDQADAVVEEGAAPGQVDRAIEAFGFPMGPFRLRDLIGLDVGWAIRKASAASHKGGGRPHVADPLCERGRFGQKTGAGFYRYEAGRREPLPDPEVEAVIAEFRKARGITPRAVDDREVVDRCMLALVNEGARILEEKVAERASDIDIVYLQGYAFPASRGGPMFYADARGLKDVVARCEAFERQTGDAFWKPAPLLGSLAAEGRTFNGAG